MSYEENGPVPVPADIDRPDKIVFGLTARQAATAAVTLLIVWAGYEATRRLVPLPVFAAFAFPLVVAGTALVIIERDGLPLDRLIVAAWRQARSPRRLVTAPEGVPAPPAWTAPGSVPSRLPAVLEPLWRQVSPGGALSLGTGGTAVISAASTVNLALRSPTEQDAVTAAYGRWANSLTGPVQVLIRAGRADLSPAAAELRDAAPGLPHPRLEAAALEHAGFLENLADERDVLTRQALIVSREPGHGDAAAARAAQRAAEAARLLAGAGIAVTGLDSGQVTALLASCADPAGPPAPDRLAVPGQPVTAGGPA